MADEVVPAESFYNVIGRSPFRLPGGLFLFANGDTVWCNGAHEELLKSNIRQARVTALDFLDGRGDPQGYHILGHRLQFIKTGVEGDVTTGVYGMRAENSRFREIFVAMNRDGSRENVLLTEMFARVATRWMGYGRTDIASADDPKMACTEIIIRHHPDRPTGPKRYRWTMSLQWNMLDQMVELGRDGIESFWRNVEAAYEEECRRVCYRQQEAKALGDKIVDKLAKLRQMIADRQHQDDIDRMIRAISDLESRLRDGTYWEEF